MSVAKPPPQKKAGRFSTESGGNLDRASKLLFAPLFRRGIKNNEINILSTSRVGGPSKRGDKSKSPPPDFRGRQLCFWVCSARVI